MRRRRRRLPRRAEKKGARYQGRRIKRFEGKKKREVDHKPGAFVLKTFQSVKRVGCLTYLKRLDAISIRFFKVD